MTAPGDYIVVVIPHAARQLRRFPPGDLRRRIRAAINALAHDPRPTGSRRLKGQEQVELRRVRVGDYRIIYTVFDSTTPKGVEITDIGHRKDVYRDL